MHHAESKQDPSPLAPGQRLGGHDVSNEAVGGTSGAPKMRVTHSIGEVDDAESFPRMSFPRHEEQRPHQRLVEDDAAVSSVEHAPSWRVRLDEEAWAQGALLMAWTAILSLAGIGLYLLLG